MIDDAERITRDLPGHLRDIVRRIYEELVEGQGCAPYVKTIYIGFEADGEMVAAVYPHAKSVEIALALPEDHGSELLVDGTHLTWRTLPLAAEILDTNQLEGLVPLLAEAADRVRTYRHHVNRDPDFFIGRTRRLSDSSLVKPKASRVGPEATRTEQSSEDREPTGDADE